MPRQNNRQYNSNNSGRSNSNRNSGFNRKSNRKSNDARANKFGADKFQMLNFGTCFLDEVDGNSYEFKARLVLKKERGSNDLINVFDSNENEYTPAEAAQLLAKALLSGAAINVCFFPQDDGTWSGNARVNIKEVVDEEDEEQPVAKKSKPAKAKAKVSNKPKYDIPQDDDDVEEEEDTEETDDEDDDEEDLY